MIGIGITISMSQEIKPSSGTPPSAPSNLAASQQNATEPFITLQWTLSVTANCQYEIWKSTDNITFTLLTTTGINTQIFTDGSTSYGVTYYYKVRAKKSGLFSAFIGPVNLTTQIPVPAFSDKSVVAAGAAPWIVHLLDKNGLPTGYTGVILDGGNVLTSASAIDAILNSTGSEPGSFRTGSNDYLGASGTPATYPCDAITSEPSYSAFPNGTFDCAVINTFASGNITFNSDTQPLPWAGYSQDGYPDTATLVQFGWRKYLNGVVSTVTALRSTLGTRTSYSTANSLGAPHITTVTTDMIALFTASTEVYGGLGTVLMAADGAGGYYAVGTCNDYPSASRQSFAVHQQTVAEFAFIFTYSGVGPTF